MEFKVTFEVDGKPVEMIVLFAGATVNLEFFKEGKSVQKYEQLPVEILSQISEQELDDADEETGDAPVVDLTEGDAYEYGSLFDGLGDLDQLLAEAAEDIECEQLANRLKPICKRNFQAMDRVAADITNAFSEPEYVPAVTHLKSGLTGLSKLSETFLRDLGGNGDSSVTGSGLLYNRFGRRRERRRLIDVVEDVKQDLMDAATAEDGEDNE